MSVDVSADGDDSSTARVSVAQRRQADARRWRYSNILVPLLLAVLVFAVLFVSLSLHRRKLNAPVVETQPIETPGLLDTIKNAVSGTDHESEESASDTGLANIKLELLRTAFDLELAQATQAVRHSESAKSSWSNLLEATLSDRVAKRIAGSEQLLLRYVALRNIPAPEQVIWDLASDLRILRNEANGAADGVTLERLTSGTATTKQNAYIAFAFHQARVNELHSIRQSAASLPLSDHDIASALARRDADLAAFRNSAAKKAAQELWESLDRELAQVVQQRREGAALVSQLQSALALIEKGEALVATSDVQIAQTQGSRDDYQRELTKIRTDLVAFTTPGYVQPESADKLVYQKVKRPFSYSALQRIGALKDTEEGRETLLRVGGSKTATQQNDRPLGKFPKMDPISESPEPEITARLKEAQRLLRKYGHLMIEDGLLSP